MTATNAAGSDDDSFTITVVTASDPPTQTRELDDQTFTVGKTFTYDFSQVWEGATSFTVESSDESVVSIEARSRLGVYRATAVAAGDATITVTATNAAGSDDDSFTITVVTASDPPTQTRELDDQTFTVGKTFTYDFSQVWEGASSFTVESSDESVVSIEARSRLGVYRATAEAVGSATITVTATNAAGSDSDSFTITVKSPPTWTRTLSDLPPPEGPAVIVGGASWSALDFSGFVTGEDADGWSYRASNTNLTISDQGGGLSS